MTLMDPVDLAPMRRAVLDASDDDLRGLASEIREALEGDSNDAENDALMSVAAFLGVKWSSE